MPRRRRRRRGSNKGKLGFISLASLVAIILAILFIYDGVYAPPETDQLTQCPLDPSYIPRDVFMLVDTTEPMADSQVERVNNILNNIIQELEVYSRVRIFTVDSGSTAGVTQSSRGNIQEFCRGGQTWMDSPYRRRLADFLPAVLSREIFADIDNSSGQPNSPIIDALRMLASVDDGNSQSLEVHIFSDLIENSRALNMYQENWFQNQYIQNRQSLINQRPIFRDSTSIVLWTLLRPERNIQDEEWREFWIQYLTGTTNLTNVNLRFEAITGGL